MKKFLRFAGILLLIIIAGVVILGLVAPKETTVERSLVINAPKDVVKQEMFQYRNFNNWNPWVKMEPGVPTEVVGDEGKPGISYSWNGKEIGAGSMELLENNGDEMKYAMHFKKPFKGEADGFWRVSDDGNGKTKAVWTFRQEPGFFMRAFGMVMGMKKMLDKSFDDGLATLKERAEKKAKESPVNDYSITETQFSGHTYAAIRKEVKIDESEMMKFFDETYQAIGKEAGERIEGPAACIAYKWDESNHIADLAPGFPVKGSEPVNGATIVNVPSTKALMTVHNGPYENLPKAHEAMGKYLAANSKAHSLIIEEYITGPGTNEKDPNKWVTNIYYLAK
jgi:effector-binding domain-containing protein